MSSAHDKHSFGLLAIHAATILLGFIGLFGKWLSAPTILIVLGRSFFEALALFVLLFILRRTPLLRNGRDYFFLIGLGIIQTVQWLTFFESIKVSSVAIGLLSLFTFPLFLALLEPLLLKEKWRAMNLITSICILGGILLIVPDFRFENQNTRGVLWGLLSSVTLSLMLLMTRRFVRSYDSITISLYKSITATVLLLPFFYSISFEWTGREVGLIALLGIVFTALPYLLITNSLRTLNAHSVGLIISLEPIYGIVLALVFLHEIPAPRTIMGGILILGVSLYATWHSRRATPVPVE